MSDRHAVPASCVQSKPVKSTITKKSGKAKKGLAAKKVSKIDFESLEKDAEKEAELEKKLPNKTNEASLPESIQLAYDNLSIHEKNNESKLNQMTEKKKVQAERLGMGFGQTKVNDRGHSLDMVTIEQTKPKKHNKHNYDDDDDDDKFFDAQSTTRGGDYYKELEDGWLYYDQKPVRNTKKTPKSYDVIEPIFEKHKADSNLFGKSIGDGKKSTLSQQSHKQTSSTSSNADLDRNSKSVSSDQLFSRHQQHEQMSHTKMEGRSGISSDDFYGRTSTTRNQNTLQQHVPDLYDIKEGVRQGVRSVAGKLSSVVGAINEAIEDRRFN